MRSVGVLRWEICGRDDERSQKMEQEEDETET